MTELLVLDHKALGRQYQFLNSGLLPLELMPTGTYDPKLSHFTLDSDVWFLLTLSPLHCNKRSWRSERRQGSPDRDRVGSTQLFKSGSVVYYQVMEHGQVNGETVTQRASTKTKWVFQLTTKIGETVVTAWTSLELGQREERCSASCKIFLCSSNIDWQGTFVEVSSKIGTFHFLLHRSSVRWEVKNSK